MNWKLRALMAGEPRWDTPDGGSGDSASGDGNTDKKTPSEFDKGYGKGADKGRREAAQEILNAIGVASVDDLKALKEKAAAADEAARKAAEENGQFKELYERDHAEIERLKPYEAQVQQIREAQKAELATITEKLTDEDRAILDGLPVDKQLSLAKRMAAGGKTPVGAPPSGNGGEPGGGDGGMTLDQAADLVRKKGFGNLSDAELSQVKAVMEKHEPEL